MSLVSRATTRIGAATVAVALAAGAIAALPSTAQAADPQVCVTAIGPTAATQPWDDFVRSDNTLWRSKTQFSALVAQAPKEFAKLGPSSTEAEIAQVADPYTAKLEIWYIGMQMGLSKVELDAGALSASLELVSPGTSAAAMDEIQATYASILEPRLNDLTDNSGALETFVDTLIDNVTGTFPLTGPVVIPSSSAAVAAIGAAAQAMDQWHDTGKSHVVLSTTPTTTCTATATLNVPSASTTFGKATSVAINATKDDLAIRGDLVVLLDGQQIGSGDRVSSYTAAIPADLVAGTHVLTVAFAPVDGGPIATKSSTVTVSKVATTAALKLSKSKVKRGKKVTATVKVAVPGSNLKANGVATVKVGKKTFTAKITNGKGTVSLGKPKAGRYSLKATYTGATSLAASTSSKVKLSVKKR